MLTVDSCYKFVEHKLPSWYLFFIEHVVIYSLEFSFALSSNPSLRRDQPGTGDRPKGLAPSTGSVPIQDGLTMVPKHKSRAPFSGKIKHFML